MKKMKLDNDDKAFILEQKEQGLSSRTIAGYIGCGKSTVNDFLKKVTQNEQKPPSVNQEKQKSKARILFLDIETSADIVATFGRHNVNLSESNIVHQGNQILTAAWKFKGDVKPTCTYVDYLNFYPMNNTGMTEEALLSDLLLALEEADAVVIHNARFDLGTIQQRALVYGFGKLPSVKVIDTLDLAKKHLKLRSNKLDSITKYFGLANKMSNDGIRLWIDYQLGSSEAQKKMLEYNKQDVVALEAVYAMFEPLQSTFNHGLVAQSDKPVCPSCGSTSLLELEKPVRTTVGAYASYHCTHCGAESRGRKNLLSKEVRQNLLVPVA